MGNGLHPISLTPFKKAFAKLVQFSEHLSTEQEKAGAIQAFEYTFELAWKMMKRFLELRGRSAYSPREVFRLAVLEGFIDDPELWFLFLAKRNLTSHTYEQEEADEVVQILPKFIQEIEKLIAHLEML